MHSSTEQVNSQTSKPFEFFWCFKLFRSKFNCIGHSCGDVFTPWLLIQSGFVCCCHHSPIGAHYSMIRSNNIMIPSHVLANFSNFVLQIHVGFGQ